MHLEAPVFLFLSHRLDRGVVQALEEWCQAAWRVGDCWLLTPLEGRGGNVQTVETQIHHFETAKLQKTLGFAAIRPGIVPGNTHFPLFDFFRQHPRHSHYWIVEYDVRFSGSWSDLFARMESETADFVTCHLRRHGLTTWDWHWWGIDHPNELIAPSDRIAGFNPFYRISHRAIASLDRELQTGWRGHSETLLPSLIARMSFSLRDFAANGEFPAVAGGQFCTPHGGDFTFLSKSTMRYRPAHTRIASASHRLYHPVKTGPDLARSWLQYCHGSLRLLGRRVAGRKRQPNW